MAPRSRLSLAKPSIVATFDASASRVMSRKDVAAILSANRELWRLAQGTSLNKFIEYLLDKTPMRAVELVSERYSNIRRFVWGENVSQYEIFLSYKSGSYLCHATAVYLHGLSDLLPQTVYVNSEQTPKPSNRGGLTQSGIDRAFLNSQRRSNLIYELDGYRAQFIAGKSTGGLGVVPFEDPVSSRPIRITDVERTLIDCVVRPAYAGGLINVLDAFRSARQSVSANRIRAYLRKMNYTYPYHQSVGYFMSRAGYGERSLTMMRDMGLDFDFYLDYGLVDPELDRDWRVYVPRGL